MALNNVRNAFFVCIFFGILGGRYLIPFILPAHTSENRKSWFLIFLLKLTCSTKAKTHFYLLILYVTIITKHFYFIISDFKLNTQNMFWIFHNPLVFQFCF
jgi:hypothetical protein